MKARCWTRSYVFLHDLSIDQDCSFYLIWVIFISKKFEHLAPWIGRAVLGDHQNWFYCFNNLKTSLKIQVKSSK